MSIGVKIRKIVKGFCFIIIITFSIIGVYVTGTVLHEFTHVKDYEDLVIDGEVCLFLIQNVTDLSSIWDSPRGFYDVKYNLTDTDKINDINGYTERRAYRLEGLLYLLYIICLIGSINRLKGREN